MIGGVSAQAMVTGGDADTGGWEPGNSDAARDTLTAIGAGAVLTGLASRGADAADDMSGAYTSAIGRILAGADGDVTADDLADALAEVIADPEMASGLALTQVSTYAGQAAMDVYMANGTGYGRWVDAGDQKVCPRCLQNAAAGRVKIGQAYPSGDVNPPAHPACRCAVVPDWA